MRSLKVARVLMSGVLVTQAVLGFWLDWSGNHLLHPDWHPHARFHGALLLFLLAGVSATALWLLWRRSAEPEVAVKAAGMISLSFWTPFFYITALLPQATPWAGAADRIPHLLGRVFYPNIATAAGFALLTIAAMLPALRSRAGSAPAFPE